MFESELKRAVELLTPIVKHNQPIMVCGNGGSASDAEHIVAELVGAFKVRHRNPINAISLGSNAAVVTAIANDYGYNIIFARQVEAHGMNGGALIAISTSGNSKNVCLAAGAAQIMRLPVICLTGEREDNQLVFHSDVVFSVPEKDTAKVQEMHIQIYHKLCEELEKLVL